MHASFSHAWRLQCVALVDPFRESVHGSTHYRLRFIDLQIYSFITQFNLIAPLSLLRQFITLGLVVYNSTP